MPTSSHAGPGLARRVIGALVAGLVLIAWGGPFARPASAAGNASSAAGFIEKAQNADGGFSETRGQPSNHAASLWATVALLAAGKNPNDERVNNGASAGDYLAAHLSAYRSLVDLGLLAIVQAGSGGPAARYGDAEQQLRADLTVPAVRSDPRGAALGIIGLLALHANSAARGAAQTLLAAPLSDGGWGSSGASDSASTALALEAITQSGAATNSDRTIQTGIDYLHRAQVNDGSIAISDRTDASSSGDVAATAFTIQALAALHHPTLRTSTGTSVLAGLASYQQMSSGGLSPFGAYDTGVAPSVTQTAQAYPAFDGIAFPLPYVAPLPQPPKHTTTTPTAPARASAGTASTGISSTSPGPKKSVGAYRGGTATGSVRAKAGRRAASPGSQVSGAVVGATSAPKLTTRAGRAPAKDLTALYLALLLAGVAALGALLDRRPPGHLSRSFTAAAVQAVSDFLSAAKRRGSVAPVGAVLVGALLIAVPSVTGMWERAPKGAEMIKSFAPYMQPAQLSRLRGDVSALDAGVREAVAKGPALQFPHTSNASRRFAANDPELSSFASQWPAIHRRFANVLNQVGSNRSNYEAIAGLPSLRLFPWFLLAPGAVLVLLGAAALVLPRLWRRLRWGVAALAVGLLLAPLALGLFGAGARGAHMIQAFRTVETRSTVTALQNDFSSLTIGQGSLRTELPPKVAASLPAVTALNQRWVAILGDFTPMLGVMSDSVANYQAVAALPDFTVFPWLFAVAGALAAAVALLTGASRPFELRRRAPAAETQLGARSSA